MPSVSWNARDQLGRMIEVTSDTVMDVAPPGPESISVGGDVQQAVLSRTTTLTDAQVKALPTTGIELVPAPGAGKVLQFVSATVQVDATAGAYSNVSGTACLFGFNLHSTGGTISTIYDETDQGALQDDSAVHLLFFAARTAASTDPDRVPWMYDISNAEDNPISFIANNSGSGNLTGGNAANSMTVTVLYTVVDLT